MKRKTPLRHVSKKRAVQLREYSKLRKEFLEAHPYCQWWLAENGVTEREALNNNGFAWLKGSYTSVSIPRSEAIHHKSKRRGEMLNDTSTWMACSNRGHEHIESHKSEARAKGYLDNF